MHDWLHNISVFFGSERYNQHAICLFNDQVIMAVYVAADLSIFAAYMAIGITLLVKRIHIVSLTPTALALYGAFIVLCGLSHASKVLTLFAGVYRLDVIVVALTAAVSLATAWLTVASVYGGTDEAEART